MPAHPAAAAPSPPRLLRSAVETLSDYRRSFALFPLLYLCLFAIRGVCIAAFNPIFALLGSRALPPRAVLFATWGGLRGAISLIMAQAVITTLGDERYAAHSELVAAQASWSPARAHAAAVGQGLDCMLAD